MSKIFFIVLLSIQITSAQKFSVEKASGNVKAQIGTNEKWTDVKVGAELPPFSTISTEKNSSVILNNGNIRFTLKDNAAVTVSNIKSMSINDLLLALAMEDMINAPRKKEQDKSKSTTVYGNQNGTEKLNSNSVNNFGMMRLNGAKQLGESGLKESAIIAAKETYRKYPETKKEISYRIYFANLLYEKGLYEEAFTEFSSFKNFVMNEKNKSEVDAKLELLNKKLINK